MLTKENSTSSVVWPFCYLVKRWYRVITLVFIWYKFNSLHPLTYLFQSGALNNTTIYGCHVVPACSTTMCITSESSAEITFQLNLHHQALWDELWFVNMGYTNKIWLIDWLIKCPLKAQVPPLKSHFHEGMFLSVCKSPRWYVPFFKLGGTGGGRGCLVKKKLLLLDKCFLTGCQKESHLKAQG